MIQEAMPHGNGPTAAYNSAPIKNFKREAN